MSVKGDSVVELSIEQENNLLCENKRLREQVAELTKDLTALKEEVNTLKEEGTAIKAYVSPRIQDHALDSVMWATVAPTVDHSEYNVKYYTSIPREYEALLPRDDFWDEVRAVLREHYWH